MEERIAWVFDLDNTLLEVPEKFEKAIVKKMQDFLMDNLHLSFDGIEELRRRLKKKHQTDSTAAAFMLEGLISDFKSFVGQTYLAVDPKEFGVMENVQLRKNLSFLPGLKYIFTNNSGDYAVSVCRALGILDLFEVIFGIEDVDFVGKPNKQAFERIIGKLSEHDYRIFIDDQMLSIEIAEKTGFIGVKIGMMEVGDCDLKIFSVYELNYEKVISMYYGKKIIKNFGLVEKNSWFGLL